MHANIYPMDATQVGLVGILLTSTTLSFVRRFFDGLITEFQESFGYTNNARMTLNKIQRSK